MPMTPSPRFAGATPTRVFDTVSLALERWLFSVVVSLLRVVVAEGKKLLKIRTGDARTAAGETGLAAT